MSLIVDPPHNPKDISAWRREAFERLGYNEVWAAFLAEQRIELEKVRSLVSQGAKPTTAARIVAGTDFFGEDSQFDWESFDALLIDEAAKDFEQGVDDIPDVLPEEMTRKALQNA